MKLGDLIRSCEKARDNVRALAITASLPEFHPGPEVFGPGRPYGYVCPWCSAVVEDREKHAGWHYDLAATVTRR